MSPISMLLDLALSAQEIGGITALGLICLLQYAWHLVSHSRMRREREQLLASLTTAERDLAAALRASQGTLIENVVLCDLLAESDSDIALRRLLQSFVPINVTGVAAYFRCHETWALHDAVGIDRRHEQSLTLDPRLLGALAQSRSVTLNAAQLQSSKLGSALLQAIGDHIEQLFLFRTSPIGEPLEGAIVTSCLPETGGSEAERIAVVERLVSAAGRYFRRSAVAAAQEQELRMTREILELRSVVDLEFRSPQEMVEQFLGRLIAVCEFDHAGVYLLRRKDGVLTRLSSSAGPAALAHCSEWQASERRVSETAIQDTALRTHNENQLRALPFDVAFRSVVTVPMRVGDEPVGVLCLSGSRSANLSESNRELIQWSSEYLLETILKTVDRASIEARASCDALTGLANRHAFDDALQNYVRRAARTGRDCTLILVDIDHFKQINDRYGHPAGDQALRTVAELVQEELRLHVRGTDRPLAARYGGEEIAVLLPSIGLAGGMRVAERIRHCVEQASITTPAGEFQVTLSAGVAVAPAQASQAAELVQFADAALYNAKRGGRNRVVAFDDNPETDSVMDSSERASVTVGF